MMDIWKKINDFTREWFYRLHILTRPVSFKDTLSTLGEQKDETFYSYSKKGDVSVTQKVVVKEKEQMSTSEYFRILADATILADYGPLKIFADHNQKDWVYYLAEESYFEGETPSLERITAQQARILIDEWSKRKNLIES